MPTNSDFAIDNHVDLAVVRPTWLCVRLCRIPVSKVLYPGVRVRRGSGVGLFGFIRCNGGLALPALS